ncbi:MAG: 2-C-methyl-D-erythritol 2,4-cyclodiphosphate synthase [Synergistaceae bacterium]|jgi:2-C-methyl-D-erythritol 4-phosphate cytidylyltransferase/2-C-methyl-D-erythritol 2,4-cyclodiphosphate synthase|nr:2-C-methyl-D-erythritol 2,4-cyclodiphosphate synthase [Synergistaceae bacterium]
MSKAGRTWSFILVAAGAGSRIGGVPKQFRTLGDRAMWIWSADVADELFSRGLIDELVVVFPSGCGAHGEGRAFKCPSVYIEGGSSRTESVKNGVAASSSDYVMIHDAARPFVSAEICSELIKATTAARGAIPLLASVDSLKKVNGGVISILSRDEVMRTQTPQCFHRGTLAGILEVSAEGGTDEASLWLESSMDLTYVQGSEENFKVTTEFDWLVARSLVNERREVRVGIGYDVHELVPGRRLILGGVLIASPLGLLGHSDADVICHAVADALLGATGEGDIGTLFPASDEKYRDADSTVLLSRVIELVTIKKWRITWLDIILKAQIPRIGHEISRIADNLQKVFTNASTEIKLNLSVKSGEFVGSVGRAECMECYAAATAERFV